MGTRNPRVRIQEGDPPSRMLTLTHEQFYNVVDQDVRARLDPAVSPMLRDPAVIERWYLMLVQMKKNVESQLASAKADWKAALCEILSAAEDAATDQELSDLRVEQFTKCAAYNEARAKKLRFRSVVEDRLSEARYLRGRILEERATQRLAYTAARSHDLAQAIAEHQSRIGEDGDSDDHELWAVLGNGDGRS